METQKTNMATFTKQNTSNWLNKIKRRREKKKKNALYIIDKERMAYRIYVLRCLVGKAEKKVVEWYYYEYERKSEAKHGLICWARR